MELKKTIVIKPTMNCNLRCGYCYEFDRNGETYCKDVMSVSDLNSIVKRVAEIFPTSKILWMFHGGEPLLLGAKYIEKFADCVRETNRNYSTDFQIALQTNATLLTDECVQVLERNADLLSERIISVSVDGPKAVNDITRHFASGESVYDKIQLGIEKLRNSKLAFSTISVIGSHNVDKAAEVYEYLRGIGANLCKFVPNYNAAPDGKPKLYGIRPLEFAKFMREIFDLWMRDLPRQTKENKMVIEPIASIICTLSKSVVTWCEYRKEKCSNFTCIYPNGEMWLCDNFIHDTMKDTAYLKNIYELSDAELKETLSNPNKTCAYSKFYDEAMKECAECEIFEYCYGGCLPTRNEMRKKSLEFFEEYCEGKKMLINYIKRCVDLAMS